MQIAEMQNPADRPGFANNFCFESEEKYTSPQHDVKPSQAAILRNWANFLDLIASMLARREPVSRAGQSCVLHIADLMREAADVLE